MKRIPVKLRRRIVAKCLELLKMLEGVQTDDLELSRLMLDLMRTMLRAMPGKRAE